MINKDLEYNDFIESRIEDKLTADPKESFTSELMMEVRLAHDLKSVKERKRKILYLILLLCVVFIGYLVILVNLESKRTVLISDTSMLKILPFIIYSLCLGVLINIYSGKNKFISHSIPNS